MSTWEERAAEARRLGRQVGTVHADRRLLDLLLDSEDTAVSQAAADVLLDQNDARGVRLYVIAFGQAEDDTRNKLGDCLYDDSGLRWDAVGLRLRSLVADPEAEVRHGATVLAEHMRDQARHHTPPQVQPAAVWQGRPSGEAFADLLRQRADNRDWRLTVEVQQEQLGGYGVSAEWGDGPEQKIMYEVVDWVDGCRLLDHHGEDTTVEQGLAYFEARAAGMGYRQALVHADPSRASFLSRWRVQRRRR